MTAALEQTPAAAFPDRPRTGGVGLRVTLGVGGDGASLRYAPVAPLARLHTRFAIRSSGATGGRVVLLAGFDNSGVERFRLTLDAATHTITVDLPNEMILSAALPAAPYWHVIELAVDTVSGEASLRLNGLAADEAIGAAGNAVTTFRLGALRKDVAAVGSVDLDEWAVADAPVGLVRVEPVSEYADDPGRWLVVYNIADPDAAAWAEYYRAARGVPYANLCGLTLPLDETITQGQFADLNTALGEYLDHNGLRDQVVGLLLGYRVPGYADLGEGGLEPVAGLLHRDDPEPGPIANAAAVDALPGRPTVAALGGNRMTARLDGPDLAAAIALVDRATAVINEPLTGDSAAFTLDLSTTDGLSAEAVLTAQGEWAAGLDRQRLRLPFGLHGATNPAGTLANDGFYWGWSTPRPPVDWLSSEGGRRVFAGQFHPTPDGTPTLRTAISEDWIGAALAGGYAAAAGPAHAVSPDVLPYPRPFFEALRRGWTLAEAWYVALPVLREGLAWVGDPLMRVTMPRAGWDVFGPAKTLERIDLDSPLTLLPKSGRAFVLPTDQRPGEGDSARYLLRRVDGDGRIVSSATAINVTMHQGVALPTPTPPAWPDHNDWPAAPNAGVVTCVACWDRPLRRCAAEEIVLETDAGSGFVPLANAAIHPLRRSVNVTLDAPVEPTRYRWRITGPGGGSIVTPPSAVVQPFAESLHTLASWEACP